MGAHAAGEFASQMATENIPQCYLKRTAEEPATAIRNSILEVHQQIKAKGASDDAFRDMGTTVDALLLLPEGAVVGHVGDSRVYRLRDRVYEQLTFDHSLVWEVKRNKIFADRMPEYIPKNVITRSLGPTDNLEVDLEGPFPLKQGDQFLLCSDGLSGQITDDEMGQILEILSPDEATETLINLANLRGGPDNITVVVVKVIADPEQIKETSASETVYEEKKGVSRLSWSLFASSLVSLLVFLGGVAARGTSFFREYPVFSVIFLIVFLVLLLLFILSLFLGKRQKPNERVYTGPLGKGPYVRSKIVPNQAFFDNLHNITNQLCDAVRQQVIFNADWQSIAKMQEQADSCIKTFNYTGAIRACVKIINYMMREIRNVSSQK